MEVLLPLIGATILDDWPGGIRQVVTNTLASLPHTPDLSRLATCNLIVSEEGTVQEAQAAGPMMEDLLRRLKADAELQGPLKRETWVISSSGCSICLSGDKIRH